jgi:hypothetical protein
MEKSITGNVESTSIKVKISSGGRWMPLSADVLCPESISIDFCIHVAKERCGGTVASDEMTAAFRCK